MSLARLESAIQSLIRVPTSYDLNISDSKKMHNDSSDDFVPTHEK